MGDDTASFQDLATGTLAAISYLQTRQRHVISDIGVLGASQGSQVAPADRLAALGKPNIRVIVFEGSGHALEDPEGMGNNYVREDALELILDFIVASTQAP